MRGQRGTHTLRVLIFTKVIFSFRKSVSRDVRTEYNLDLRFLVKFNVNSGFVVGTQTFFVGIQELSLCFSWYTRGLCSQAMHAKN